MPMDFPDLKSLRNSFDYDKGIPYKDGETEAEYRERCAVHSEIVWRDPVQAQEIRCKKGWDRWNDADAAPAIEKHPDPMSNPMLLNKMVDRVKRQSN